MSVHTAQLGDFVSISGGGTPSRNRPEFFNGPIPWVTVKDMGSEFFLRSTQEHISKAGLDSSASRLISVGNVLLATRMAVGRAVINKVEVAINQDLKALTCGPRLHPGYLLFFLTHKASELEAKATGATVKGITIDEIESLEIPLPDLPKQKRIAGLLEQADRLRRTRRYALELSDTFVPAAFRELFGDPIKNDKGWQIAELGEYIDFLTSGSRGWATYYAEQGDIFIRIQNVGHGQLLLDDLTFVAAPQNAEARRTLVKPGDVLLSITADLGRSAAIPSGFPPAYINQHLALIRQTKLNPIFLATLLSCDAARNRWAVIDRDAVKSGLNFDDIRRFCVIAPPMSDQQHFAALVARHEGQQVRQREALRQADYLFQSLLHRAFATGL